MRVPKRLGGSFSVCFSYFAVSTKLIKVNYLFEICKCLTASWFFVPILRFCLVAVMYISRSFRLDKAFFEAILKEIRGHRKRRFQNCPDPLAILSARLLLCTHSLLFQIFFKRLNFLCWWVILFFSSKLWGDVKKQCKRDVCPLVGRHQERKRMDMCAPSWGDIKKERDWICVPPL